MPEHSPGTTAEFPVLASLALGAAQFAALAEQGYLSAAGSGPGRRYYRLRFRMGLRQHVRYVGNNAAFVAQVRKELARLQADRNARRQSQRRIRAARNCLRRTKRQLEPLLRMAGYTFYGREIRRPAPPRDTRMGGDETQTQE